MSSEIVQTWGYKDILPPQTAAPEVVQPAPRPTDLLHDPERLKGEITALQAVIPAELAHIFSTPQLSSEYKIELAHELAQLNQSALLSERDVAAASPEIRPAAQRLREHKDQIAAGERELAGMLAVPIAGGVATVETAVPANPHQQDLLVATRIQQSELKEEWQRRPQFSGVTAPSFATASRVEAVPADQLRAADQHNSLAVLGDLSPDRVPDVRNRNAAHSILLT